MSKTAIITGGNKVIGLAVAKDLISKKKNELEKKYNIKIDYLELGDSKNLKLTNKIKNAKIFIAYYINKVRLIDNL